MTLLHLSVSRFYYVAAQDQAISTNCFKRKILKEEIESRYRLCKEYEEIIEYNLEGLHRRHIVPDLQTVKYSCPATRNGGAWGKRRYSSYTFFTSATIWGEWSASRPAALYPRVSTSYIIYRYVYDLFAYKVPLAYFQ
jgi:hypothetical protein